MIETTVSINGMACGMCESHVNDVVRQNFQIKKVTSSHRWWFFPNRSWMKKSCVLRLEQPDMR